MRNLVLVALSVPLLGLASCAGPNVHLENRQVLEQMAPRAATGDTAAVTGPLQSVILRTNEEPEGFAKQRYFAAYLLSRAWIERSASVGGADWLGDSMKAVLFRGYAEDWEKDARGEGKVAENGEALLPRDLDEFGVDGAVRFLDLAWLLTCSRTKFQREADDVLGESLPELKTFEGAEAFCTQLGVTDALRAWVYWGLFDLLRRDVAAEPEAFKFGIRARELSKAGKANLGTDVLASIVAWIQTGSSYRFVDAFGTPFDPGLDSVDDTANIDLIPELKTSN